VTIFAYNSQEVALLSIGIELNSAGTIIGESKGRAVFRGRHLHHRATFRIGHPKENRFGIRLSVHGFWPVHQDFCPNPVLAIYDLKCAASKHGRYIVRADPTHLRQEKYQEDEVDNRKTDRESLYFHRIPPFDCAQEASQRCASAARPRHVTKKPAHGESTKRLFDAAAE
jgi:hypothetical protein